ASLMGWSLDDYTPGKMTYDLRRLRLKGLITKVPGTHRYRVTTYGLKTALFVSKLYLRIVRPGWLSLEPQDDLPRDLAHALSVVDAEINRLCDAAKLRPAA